MSGELNGTLSKQIDMSKAKAYAKSQGTTFGDLIAGIINKSMK